MRAFEIDDEPCWIGEREILDHGGTLQVDDDLDLAGRRQHTHRADFSVASCRPGKGPGNDSREQDRKE